MLQIEVPFSDGAGEPWPESLGLRIDDVHLELPREYVQAILDAAARHGAKRFPPGTVRVVEAAHGRVGSSPNLFGRLASCVLELMRDDRDDEQTIELLRSRLVRLEA